MNSGLSNGLLHLYGMEREILLTDNGFIQNTNCQYIIRLHGESQSPQSMVYQSIMQRNILHDNEICVRRRNQFMNPWECYVIGVFGTQNITLRYNSFDNCKMNSKIIEPCYELIAGLQSIQIPSFFNAQHNYWGTTDVIEIRKRIFDFDQWNSLSLINFNEFLISSDVVLHQTPSKVLSSAQTVDLKKKELLEGRIEKDLFIPLRTQPYKIMSDITVMPDVTLRIEAGVRLEFAPHIGLLVLGRIEAHGTPNNPIIFTNLNSEQTDDNKFTSVKKSKYVSAKFRKPNVVKSKQVMDNDIPLGRITLSTENIRLIGGIQPNEGFVQFFNHTTKRWSIACDNQFSSRVAQVICSEFNMPTLNPIARFSNLFDYYVYGYENSLNMKYIWMESYTCNGFEDKLAYCSKRLNYDAVRCLKRKEFVFLRCTSQRNQTAWKNKQTISRTTDLSTLTWGNIRIVQSTFEEYNKAWNDNGDSARYDKQSILEYVHIENAGLLHGERVPALSVVNAYPKLSFIRINNCLASGFEFITPNGPIKVTNSTVNGCLGYGLGLTMLNGDSTDPVTIGTEDSKSFYNNPSVLPPEQNSLLPLPQPLSGELFHKKIEDLSRQPLFVYPIQSEEEHMAGLISMCSSEKVLSVLDRILIHFKYSSSSLSPWSHGIRTCTKVFRSTIPGRRLAWRFLAVNLYNDPLIKNVIQLYNGVNFNKNQLIAALTSDILVNENMPVSKRFTFITSPISDELSVHVHASSASDKYGFIAEIVSLPLSTGRKQHEMNRFIRHEIDTCEFLNNQGGGLQITSVGEFGPDIHLSNLRLEDNGVVVLNLTGPPAVKLHLMNSRNLVLQNSYIGRHSGDVVYMVLLANQLANGIRANLTNNVFVRNQLGGVLHAEGNPFNTLQVLRNYIAHNDCGYRTMLHINGLLTQPFANNFLYDNLADVLLICDGVENLNQYSLYQKNGFYNNQALNTTKRTTIFCKNSKNIFRFNYFRNILNDYELVTGNQSIISVMPIQPGLQCPESPYSSCPQGWRLKLEYDACICYRPDRIDAQYNWWGDTSPSSTPSLSSSPDNSFLSLQYTESKKVENEEKLDQIISQTYAQSRIYDQHDDIYLISVDYTNSFRDNSSILGKGIYCPPNWDFHEFNCFFYFGAPMTYQEAHDFCLSEVGGILATSRDRIDWLSKKMAEWQHNYDWINQYTWVTRAWVYSDVQFPAHCPVIRNGWLEPYPCNKKVGFFCQKGTEVYPTQHSIIFYREMKNYQNSLFVWTA
ncbi:unnamed protein product [Trichobilharzia szidati]|nr:unnamed protein product [Trichobilharzia szidati]